MIRLSLSVGLHYDSSINQYSGHQHITLSAITATDQLMLCHYTQTHLFTQLAISSSKVKQIVRTISSFKVIFTLWQLLTLTDLASWQ